MERLIRKIADNAYTPLGATTQENFDNLVNGTSALQRHEIDALPFPFVASLFDWEMMELEEGATRFETLAIQSVRRALAQANIDASASDVLFILSTTKANVELLAHRPNHIPEERVMPAEAARFIAEKFGNPNPPVVVSNACISGLCAQIAAMRLLQNKRYRYAVVIGADVQSPFIISGFQSFKALSDDFCKPFDRDRKGLNLGEGAATIVYEATNIDDPNAWYAVEGAVRNDANHISGPSRTGEGSFLALQSVLRNHSISDLAMVSVHGTSTLYNDEMESIALQRAGLSDVPINSLKGFYGHTMGAAGVLETILSMYAIEHHTILATKGFAEMGVSCPVNISCDNRTTDKTTFVKLLSGFGGCNAAMFFQKGGRR